MRKECVMEETLEQEIMGAIVFPLASVEDYRIRLSDIRKLVDSIDRMGAGQGARRLRRALEACGLQIRKSGPMWAYSGRWRKARTAIPNSDIIEKWIIK